MVCTPPPRANVGLTAWDDANDTFVTGGYYAAMLQVAQNYGAILYDARTDFKALVAAGTNTIAELMRDTTHPTDANSSSAGMGLYVTAIVAAAARTTDISIRNYGGAAWARIGAALSGNWAYTHYATGTGPNWAAHGILGGQTSGAHTLAMASSTASDVLTFTTPACTEIGLLGIADATVGGVVDVSVDGAAAVSINLLASGLTRYPKAFFVAGDLSNTTHTVTVTVTSGTARIVGLVGV
jgi:hypothetical protein